MSESDSARLARVEQLLEQLISSRIIAPVGVPLPAMAKPAYSAEEFGAAVGRSARWVRGKVAIGIIPRVRAAGSRNVLIPASALESFATGKARL